MNDERLVKLQERLKSLQLSCSCAGQGPGMAIAIDCPIVMGLVVEELQAFRSDVETLRGILDVQNAKLESLQAEKPKVKGRTRARSSSTSQRRAKKFSDKPAAEHFSIID
jgi:hypothetical protein